MADTHSKARYRRLILIYSLVIIIPGTFLSILSIRGIYQNYYMADKVIQNRLERKSRYFIRTIDFDINRYLEIFYQDNIMWHDSLFSLNPGREALEAIENGMIIMAAAKKPGDKIKFLTSSSLHEFKQSQNKSEVTGSFYEHLEKNINMNLEGKGPRNTRHYDFYNDSISYLLVTRIHPDYNISLVLNSKLLIRDAIHILDEREGFKNKIEWRILDEYRSLLYKSPDFTNKNTKEFSFSDHGHWTLQLEQSGNALFAIISEAEEEYIIAGFIFVLVVSGIGFVATIRSLTRNYRLSQMKSDFVSTVSHEFKSPLTSIRMMSERLAEKRVKSEKRKSDYYESMLNQSERLSHLVDNILDFSRMEKGRKKYHFQHTNIVRIAREVIDYLMIRHRELGFKISLTFSEDPMVVMIDSQAIHQVFYNLIENAIKYSGNSKKVEVEIDKQEDKIQIRVKDYGIGISKKDQKKVFGQFFRADKVSKEGVKGSGIGLSIVSEIVKAHRGKVNLESELGKGSIFIVKLPVTQN